MRRVLISLTLTVLLIVSVGTGVAVATWPQWRHWLHQEFYPRRTP